MDAVAIERAIAAGELEKRTAAPRETRRHLPPNRAEYTQPNGDHPGHIAAELYAKRDTSTRRADITEDKARTGRVDRWHPARTRLHSGHILPSCLPTMLP
jgi:hypothetical protein